MKGVGRIVGIVGGILTFIGALLPWATVENSAVTPPTSQTFLGVASGFGGILVLVFGIIGLILVAIGKRGPAIGGLIMGLLALIFALLAWVLLAALAQLVGGTGATVTTEYGIYVSLVGSIILMIGSAIATGEAKKGMAEMAPAAPLEEMMTEGAPEPPAEE